MINDLISTKIAVSAHSHLTYGPPQALREYLINQRIAALFFVSHPLNIEGEKSNLVSFCEKIISGETIEKKVSSRKEKNYIFRCFKDLFLTVVWTIKSGKRYDLFVGADNLNALAGLILRFLGRTKKVVYYGIDYFPTRFESKLLNYFYYQLDKFCVRHADETWNVSGKMAEAREKKMGMRFADYNRQKTVPIGVWFDRVERKDFSEINKRQVVFVGYLKDEMGVDLVIRALPRIIERLPDFEFLLIGGGEEYENLKKLVKELGVESHVTMTNWIKDRLRLEELMLKSAIGVAPFNIHIVDEKFYNADPAKIKDYMQMGMPVILTPVPASTEQLKEAGCAVVIDYTEESLANAIINLLQNEEILRVYRDKATAYIKNYNWDTIFCNNLARVLTGN